MGLSGSRSFSPCVSPSRALVLSCAHYFQAPATQAKIHGNRRGQANEPLNNAPSLKGFRNRSHFTKRRELIGKRRTQSSDVVDFTRI